MHTTHICLHTHSHCPPPCLWCVWCLDFFFFVGVGALRGGGGIVVKREGMGRRIIDKLQSSVRQKHQFFTLMKADEVVQMVKNFVNSSTSFPFVIYFFVF